VPTLLVASLSKLSNSQHAMKSQENAAGNNFDSYKELQIYGKVFIICSSISLSDNLFFGIYPFQTIYHFSENK
jgi:hypothetical protein